MKGSSRGQWRVFSKEKNELPSSFLFFFWLCPFSLTAVSRASWIITVLLLSIDSSRWKKMRSNWKTSLLMRKVQRGFLSIYFITSEFFTFTCDSSSFRFPLAVSFSSFLLALLLIDGDSPSENQIRWFFPRKELLIPVPKSLKVPIPATAPFRLAALRLHRIETNRLSNWSTTWREATG